MSTWLALLEKAPPLGQDLTLDELLQKEKGIPLTDFLNKAAALSELCDYATSPKARARSLITHNVNARFMNLVKVPEMFDPTKDFFI